MILALRRPHSPFGRKVKSLLFRCSVLTDRITTVGRDTTDPSVCLCGSRKSVGEDSRFSCADDGNCLLRFHAVIVEISRSIWPAGCRSASLSGLIPVSRFACVSAVALCDGLMDAPMILILYEGPLCAMASPSPEPEMAV